MYKLNNKVEMSWMDEEIILQNMDTGDVHMLNKTASFIFNCFLEMKEVSEIIQSVKQRFNDATEENIYIDIEEIKNLLIEKKILVEPEEVKYE